METPGDDTRTGVEDAPGGPPRIDAREVDTDRSSTVISSTEPSYAGDFTGGPDEGMEDERPPRLPEEEEEERPP
jgi:hypothetical protein